MTNKIANYIKTNYKDFLSLLFFIVVYVFSIFLFLGGVEDFSKPTDLEFGTFLILAGVNIALYIIFIFTEIKFFKMKVNIPLIIILVSLFVINLINVLLIPFENTIGFVYPGMPESITVTITNEYKVEYILCFLLLLFSVYTSFNYMIYRLRFNKSFVWLCGIITIFSLVFVIYSYIAEHETYKLFFENISTKLVGYNPISFTNHRNNYAAILLGGAFCSYALYAVLHKHLFALIGFFLCVNIIFPMSRLCLILAIALTFIIFVYRMIASWKQHAFRNINLIFLVAFSLTMLTLMTINIPELHHYIEHVVFTDNITGEARELLWKCALSMVNDFHVVIGFGHGYFNTIFTLANGEHVKMPHNLYLQTYGSLGIIGVICFAALIIFAIYKIIKLFKTNKDAAFISIIGLITVLAFYVFEG